MIQTRRLLLVAAALCAPALHATITINSFSPSISSPQPLGTPITWTATATDTSHGALTFRYSVAFSTGAYQVVTDFYPGTISSGLWTGPSFPWATIANEGTYHVQVSVRNYTTGETVSTSVAYGLKAISNGKNFVVTPTANPLVELASGPGCPTGSFFQVTMQKANGTKVVKTNEIGCTPTHTMNVYAAGMVASTQYKINYQVITGTTTTPGATPVTITTGPLPSTLTFPTFTVITPATSQDDQADQLLLHGFLAFGASTQFLPVATDLNGDVLWYYTSYDPEHSALLTRPLVGGDMLTIQTGNSWSPNIEAGGQFVRKIDLAGNTVQETNIGVLQQQLLAMGATDFGPCGQVALPAAVGAACLGTTHHDVIQLPNGNYAMIVDIEKIFPPGTQGDTTGLNVDIIGDGILVLDPNMQLLWYFDTFQHDSGGSQLDINRGAVLGETCTQGQGGCPTLFLAATSGVAPLAHDWLHTNCLYFNASEGDIVFSSRHQDWVMKVDYNNGTGTGNIKWRLGLDGDFTFNNTNNDPYPWFSHQHDFAYENTTSGLISVYDNGNTRVSPPPVGLGSGNSRGMALIVDETNRTASPVLSQDLGYYGFALGSAQLLANGNYFFQPGVVMPNSYSYGLELLPTAGTVDATTIFDMQSGTSYRSWMMPTLYAPPPS
jgi:hypothetical protein